MYAERKRFSKDAPRVRAALFLLLFAAAIPRMTSAETGAKPLPTPEQMLRLVRVSEPRIRPDGSLVAFTAADSLDPTLTQVWIVGTDGDGPLRPFTAGGRSARCPRWSPDGQALLFLSARADTAKEQIQWISLLEGSSRPLTNEAAGILDMEWSPDGKKIAYVTPVNPPPPSDPIVLKPPAGRYRLCILDMDDNTTRVISPADVEIRGFAWSPDGERLAVLTTPPGPFGEWRRGGLVIADADGSGWMALPVLADPLLPVAWSPSGDRIALNVRASENLAYSALSIVDSDGRNLRRLSSRDSEEDDEGVVWAADGALRTASFAGVHAWLNRIDPETGVRTRIIDLWAAPREAGRSFSVSGDGSLAFISEGPDHPADIFFLPPGGSAASRLTIMNPQLDALDLPRPEPVTWRGSDGCRIEGLLFVPPGDGGHHPLLVQPHGGPASHWSLGFYSWCESPGVFLATRGYAVLYPNPRGSSGYGETFYSLNHGDLGGGDLRDIEAGIDSLAAAGVVDGSRVALSGFSYGGTLSAYALAHSGRYRCAILGAAPFDFFTDFAQNELAPHWHREYLGGTPYENPEEYAARSPVFRVADITAPVLIVHGTADTRVLPSQSREFRDALLAAGGTVEMVLYPGEGHGLFDPKHQLDFMNRQLDWLDRYLKPAAGKEKP